MESHAPRSLHASITLFESDVAEDGIEGIEKAALQWTALVYESACGQQQHQQQQTQTQTKRGYLL